MSLLVGCSTPVAVGPVGPNPYALENSTKNGQLEVFSALTPRTEGDDPTWYQHTDYTVYNQRGDAVKHVNNTVGHYATEPRLIDLPPGQYLVKAEAKDYPSVTVPVVIDPGRMTKVHLDGTWRPADNRKTAFVRLPAGNPVGWS
ncbi:MAG TPA: hypothetical protein VH251_01075, partial [Verrucomicrobiae bacterium]|nr:hypothetical protein [Verrucomicrobiae bacterium]